MHGTARHGTARRTHRGVKAQRGAARGDLVGAEDDAHLLADLVDEDEEALGLGDGARQLPQRLAHEPRLQRDVVVPNVPVQLRLGHQRRHRVHHLGRDVVGWVVVWVVRRREDVNVRCLALQRKRTTQSTVPDLMSVSAMSRPCSPLSGCEM